MVYNDITQYEQLRELMKAQDFTFKESSCEDTEGRIYSLHVSWFDEAPDVNFIEWETITCIICLGEIAYDAVTDFVNVNPYIENVFMV